MFVQEINLGLEALQLLLQRRVVPGSWTCTTVDPAAVHPHPRPQLLGVRAERVNPAVLTLPGCPPDVAHQRRLVLLKPPQALLHLGDGVEGDVPLRPAPQLTRCLGAPQHQYCQYRHVTAVNAQHLVQQMTVLHDALTAGHAAARHAFAGQVAQGVLYFLQVIVRYRLPVALLVAGEEQSVGRERVCFRCRAFLLDEADEDPRVTRAETDETKITRRCNTRPQRST